MTTDCKVLASTDRTSWERVGMVARYYWPRLRRQVIGYPLASLAIFLISALFYAAGSIQSSAVILSITSYMFVFGPLIFTLRDDRMISTTLPACGFEKAVFILGYTFVVVPVLAYVPAYLLNWICFGWLPTSSSLMADMGIALSPILSVNLMVSSITTNLAMTGICLWTVLVVSRNRVAKAILLPFCFSLGIGFIAGFSAMISAFSVGFKAGMESTANGDAPTHALDIDLSEMVNSIVEPMTMPLIVICSAMALLAVIMSWRAVCRRQL